VTGFEGAAGAGASATGAGVCTVIEEEAPSILGSAIFFAQALRAKVIRVKVIRFFIRPTLSQIKKRLPILSPRSKAK